MTILDNYCIKMETRKGKTRWLETTSDGEKTFIFETFYVAEGEKDEGMPLSEELVAWVWGDIESEDEVKRIAARRRLKAVYNN